MDDIKRHVRENYSAVARANANCCGSQGSHGDVAEEIGYANADVTSVPEGANMGLGCGNPLAFADLKPGETVLDLGSGGGFDCFLAANVVGPTGHVIGLDMTEDMIAAARDNAVKGGYDNVEFRLGEIEAMPIENDTVDLVISNCVINLVPDKKQAFTEAFRVLKPGGRLHVSDIVLDCEKLPEEFTGIQAYVNCITGAIGREEYLQLMQTVGFVEITVYKECDAAQLLGADCCTADGPESACCSTDSTARLQEGAILSMTVSARKPC